jgi:phosphoribosylaminoimidazole-succinocarboxamide synthase
MIELLGGDRRATDLAERVREVALRLYGYGAAVAERAGILVADTKCEVGLDARTREHAMEGGSSPRSSRFWDAATTHRPGGSQPSFDKQYVRDWLEEIGWDKREPGPDLPPDVVRGTRERYVAAYERIARASFSRYQERDVIAR